MIMIEKWSSVQRCGYFSASEVSPILLCCSGHQSPRPQSNYQGPYGIMQCATNDFCNVTGSPSHTAAPTRHDSNRVRLAFNLLQFCAAQLKKLMAVRAFLVAFFQQGINVAWALLQLYG